MRRKPIEHALQSTARGSLCAKVCRHFGAMFFVAVLVGCGGGGNSSTGSTPVDPANNAVVNIAVNDDSAAGVINWSAVGSEITSLSVELPEDTSLSLVVRSDSSSSPVVIRSFPESGAAVLFDGVLEYTPDLNFFGNDFLRIERNSVSYELNITILAVNDPPEIIGDIGRVAEQGFLYTSQIRVRNVDRDVLEFSSANLPSWLTLNPQTGVLRGIPGQEDVGLHEGINLIVRDNGGLDDALVNVTLEVLDLNDAPTLNLTQFPSRLDARDEISVNVFLDDIDGDSVSLVVEPNDFVQARVSGGAVSITVNDVVEVTEINLVLIATDQLGNITREVVPLELFPLTDSGRGRTLQGKRFGSGIHLVVLGDGYRVDQLAQFREDVEFLIATMEEDPAIALHLSAWNIHMVETPSVDSGIDDSVAVDVRDTVFNSGYFCLSIPRLICGNNNIMFDVALDEYPDVDELVMLANDPRYGGSGGSVAVASSSAPEIALHEMGHSLAELADEYVDSSIPAINVADFDEGVIANVSRLQDPERVPWSAWIDVNNTIPSEIGDSGVGIFQGGYYDAQAFFRPTFNSRMRSFDQPFGPVNGEAWALSVYQETNPVATFSPRVSTLVVPEGEAAPFSVEPIFGSDIQRIVWTLDGRLLANNINDTEVILVLEEGVHTLTLSVNDLTGAIRKTGPHAAQFLWRWDITVQ